MSCAQEMTKFRTTSVVIGSAEPLIVPVSVLLTDRWPPVMTSACQPGGTSVVAVLSSIMAGPSVLDPADRRPIDDRRRVLQSGEMNHAVARRLRIGRQRVGIVGTRKLADGSNPDIGDFHPTFRTRVAVLPLIGTIEGKPGFLHVDGAIGQGDGQNIFLAVIAEVGAALE